MRHSPFKNGVLFASGIVAALGAVSIGFAAWNAAMSPAVSGNKITSAAWNAIVDNVNDLNTRVTALATTKAPHVTVTLAHCWGGCGSYHALNTWINLPTYNYTWNTTVNNATDVFTHNGKGLVTVSQPWTYLIRLRGLAMPTNAADWVEAYCPFIDGSANCVGTTAVYGHSYNPAGWWKDWKTDFVIDLSANQTIGFGYMTSSVLTYWGHDGYNQMEIVRLK